MKVLAEHRSERTGCDGPDVPHKSTHFLSDTCYKWRTPVEERRKDFIFPVVFFLLVGQMGGWRMCPCEVCTGEERMQEHAEPACTAPCCQKPASHTACIHQREPTWRKGVSWQADKHGTDRSIYHMSLFVMLRFVFWNDWTSVHSFVYFLFPEPFPLQLQKQK